MNVPAIIHKNRFAKTYSVIIGIVLAASILSIVALTKTNQTHKLGQSEQDNSINRVIDFGVVDPSFRQEVNVPIVNMKNAPLNITDFQRSCTCVDIIPKEFVLLPGEKKEVKLIIDTMKLINLTQTYPKNVNALINITAYSDIDLPLSYEVRGEIAVQTQLKPSHLSFRKFDGEDADFGTKPVEVYNYGGSRFFGVKHDHNILNATTSEDTEKHRNVILIAPQKHLAEGKYVTDVSVLSKNQDDSIHEVPLRVEIFVPKPIYTVPQALSLGSHPLNTKIAGQFYILCSPHIEILSITQPETIGSPRVDVQKISPERWKVAANISIEKAKNANTTISLEVHVVDRKTSTTSSISLNFPVYYYGFDLDQLEN